MDGYSGSTRAPVFRHGRSSSEGWRNRCGAKELCVVPQVPTHSAQQSSFNHLVGKLAALSLNLHNCLDAMNSIHPMRLRTGSYVGFVSAIKLIDDRSALSFRSIAIERPNEGTLAPSAEVKYVGPCECGNITLLAESGCKRARC